MLSKKMCLFYDSMIIGKATFIPSIILRSLIFNELTTNHDSIKVVFTKEICIETKGYCHQEQRLISSSKTFSKS